MKTLGIVGGTGPESTIEYYRLIIDYYRERVPDGSYPSLLVNSVDLKRLLHLAGARAFPELTDFMLAGVDTLARAGADFGLFAANTPHVVFDAVQKRAPIPLISIVEATSDVAVALGLRRVGLFGTRFTMRGQFYSDVFSRRAISIVVPEATECDLVHEKYVTELISGTLLDSTREALLRIVDRMIERDRIDGLILGGTELPLLLRDAGYRGIPFLDTTRIHVKRAVDEMLL
jgi:aspartate racemase